MAVAHTILTKKIDLQVYWIPGVDNTVADTLSRNNLERVHTHAPELFIENYTPPDGILEAWRG
jgi:hypothetical protein